MAQPTVESTGTITTTGRGRADYSGVVAKAKQIFGYELDYGETYLWLCTICVPTPPGPGASVITRAALAAGDTMQAIDCATGLTELTVPADWDYVIKEFWVSFNQRVQFLLYQGGSFDDVSCLGYYEADSKPINLFQVGWTRSLLEDITLASVLRCDITNLGAADAYGKVWLIGYMKEGTYRWI